MFVKFPVPGKSWKMDFGPGNQSARSWNLLGNDTEADAKMCVSANLYSINNCKKCLNSFFAISSQHVICLVAAVCLYI